MGDQATGHADACDSDSYGKTVYMSETSETAYRVYEDALQEQMFSLGTKA